MAPKRRQHDKRKGKTSSASASTSASASAPAPTSVPAAAPTASAPAAAPPASTPAAAPASTPASSPPWPATIPEVIPKKLEGVENYRWWKEQVRSIIISHNLERLIVKFLIPEVYANESDRKNDIMSEEYEEWLLQDQLLYTWLLSSVSEKLVPIIVKCIHSWEFWHTINEHMSSELKARVTELRQELNNIKKTGYLTEYLAKIKAIVDSLAEAGDPISEKEHIQAILDGLPEQYSDCVTIIRERRNLPSLLNVVSMLIVQEAQIEGFNIFVPVGCLIPTTHPTDATDSTTDRDIERPPGPPDDDNAPSASPNCPNDGGRKGRRRRGRSGRR